MLLTYRQAAEIAGVTYQTIRFAATEERLTKIITKKGPRLLEEQVRLFSGKPGISEMFLTVEEKNQWLEYKKQAERYTIAESNFQETFMEMLKAIESRPISTDKRIAAMEKVNHYLEEAQRLMTEISNDTKIEVFKEEDLPFPLLPSTPRKA